MEALKTAGLMAGALLLICGAVRADDYDWDDIFAPYRQRIDTATTSSGNAQNVNTVTQMITPWPPYVQNRRIPGNGARMVGAIERYHGKGEKRAAVPQVQSPSMPVAGAGGGASNGTGGDAQAGKPGQ